MKTLIFHYIFYKKKMIAIGLLLICYISLLLLIAITSDTKLDRMMYPEEVVISYQIISMQIMRFIGAAMMAILVFDFDNTYDLPLYAYFSKRRVWFSKFCVHFFIILLLTSLLCIFRMLMILFVFQMITIEMIHASLKLMIDYIILFHWMLIFTPRKFKQASFLIVAFYLILSMVYEDIENMIVYYIFPIYHHIFSIYLFSDLYVCIYCISLLNVIYLKALHSDY